MITRARLLELLANRDRIEPVTVDDATKPRLLAEYEGHECVAQCSPGDLVWRVPSSKPKEVWAAVVWFQPQGGGAEVQGTRGALIQVEPAGNSFHGKLIEVEGSPRLERDDGECRGVVGVPAP